MRFKVVTEKFGKQDSIKLLDSETNEYVSILPETGGMLKSLTLLLGKSLISVLDDYPTEEELLNTLESSFKGSNLFPFPNRIDKGQYLFNENHYQLFVNFPHEDNAIHGLIFKTKFTIKEKCESDSRASLVLEYSPSEDAQGFPFQYKITVEYIFDQNHGLILNTTVKNIGSGDMPLGHGWHPYIKLLSKVDELKFEFASDKSFEVNKKMIPTGASFPFNEFSTLRTIDSSEFDTCFSIESNLQTAKTFVFDPAVNSGIILWQETGKNKYNFLQVYTPEHRNTIAIEPMTCLPDALNNKKGLIILKPEETINFQCGICSYGQDIPI
jgi:aldose 1-epimerase